LETPHTIFEYLYDVISATRIDLRGSLLDDDLANYERVSRTQLDTHF